MLYPKVKLYVLQLCGVFSFLMKLNDFKNDRNLLKISI